MEEETQIDGEEDDEVIVEEEEPVAAIDAAAIYAARCARCHSADRSGNNGPALLPDRLTKDPAAYEAILVNGSGPMPSFGNRLSAEEITALVDFILSDPE
jgi:mono/diheme cytochrome c family protein